MDVRNVLRYRTFVEKGRCYADTGDGEFLRKKMLREKYEVGEG